MNYTVWVVILVTRANSLGQKMLFGCINLGWQAAKANDWHPNL